MFFDGIFKIIFKIILSETKYDPSDKLNLPFQAAACILNLLLLYSDLIFFYV